MSQWKKIGILLVLTLVLMVGGVFAQEQASFIHSETIVGGDLEIKIEYPMEITMNPVLRKIVNPEIDLIVDGFLEAYHEYGPQVSDFESPPWSLGITSEITHFSPEITSVKLIVSTYTGGAHPNFDFQTITIDRMLGEVFEFEDLFVEETNPLWQIAPIVQADLIQQMGDYADLRWVEEGTGEFNFDNYQDFVMTDESLILLFPPYQVAPYAAGSFEVSISLADLQAILAFPFYQP